MALHLVPAALLVAAIGAWPYGYYTMLRFTVCVAAFWIAYLDYQREKKIGPWVITMGLGGILFNPILPVYLTRDIWFFLDIAMAALFGLHFAVTRKRTSP